MTEVIGLTPQQAANAIFDDKTIFPDYLPRPKEGIKEPE